MSWHRKLPNQAACGSCCGIKEKLQTLWDRTINSILRINQVEPDDQGNIRIVSADDAIVITEGTNEIQIGLDQSELPAGAVQSVNGQTGAVVLNATDIRTTSNTTVENKLYALDGAVQTALNNVNTERLARQAADAQLQSNINALQASIPQEAADAVAADPTIQSFAAAAAAIPDKVDKRTGAGLRAYTHTGSTQDDTVVEDSTNGATIPIRDTNGRLQAADPAAGATDKTLTTANWISQTGSGAPNNLLHTEGTETKSGFLVMEDFIRSNHKLLNSYSVTVTLGRWVPIYKINRNGQSIPQASFFINNRLGGITLAQVYLNGSTLKLFGLTIGNSTPPENLFRVSTEDDTDITLWAYFKINDGIRADCISAYGSNGQMAGSNITVLTGTVGYAIDANGYTDENSIVHTFTRYAEMNQ